MQRRTILKLGVSAAAVAAIPFKRSRAVVGMLRGAIPAQQTLMGGNLAAGGNAAFYYEQVRLFRNLVRESRGFQDTSNNYVPLTADGWPDGTVATINVYLYGGGIIPPWQSQTIKCGFIGSGSETITGYTTNVIPGSTAVVSNIVPGTGGQYTTFDLALNGSGGFTVGSITQSVTNWFAYPASYNTGAIDDTTNVNSITNEAAEFWSQFRHVRWMWASYVPFNNQQATSSTRRTASNTQCAQGWYNTVINWSSSPGSGATSGTLASAFTGPTGVYAIGFTLSGSVYTVRMCSLANGSTAVSWSGALTAAATSTNIGFGLEGYPADWAVTLALAAGIGLWLCLPYIEDGSDYAAGTYATSVLQMLSSRWTSAKQVIVETLGNEPWNSSYDGLNTFTWLASYFDYASLYAYLAFRVNVLQALIAEYFPRAVQVLAYGPSDSPGLMKNILVDYNSTYGAPASAIAYGAIAPYSTFSGLSDSATVAEIQAAALADAETAWCRGSNNAPPADSTCEGFYALLAHFGITFVSYEGGFQWNDTTYFGSVANLGAAILDTGMASPVETLYTGILNAGIQWCTHFEIGCSSSTSAQAPVDEPDTNLTNLYAKTSPTLVGLFSVSNGAVRTRNVVTSAGSVIDGRNYLDNVPAQSASYPTLSQGGTIAPNFNGGQMSYHIYSAIARTTSLVVNFTNTGATGSTQLEYGSVQNGGYAILGGGSPTTVSIPNGTGNVTIGSFPLPAGDSYITLGLPSSSQSAISINSLTFN